VKFKLLGGAGHDPSMCSRWRLGLTCPRFSIGCFAVGGSGEREIGIVGEMAGW